MNNHQHFRAKLDQFIDRYPEWFPVNIERGYQLYGLARASVKMPDIKRQRIRLNIADAQGWHHIYTVVPSFVLPYIAGTTDEVEHALFLRRFFGR